VENGILLAFKIRTPPVGHDMKASLIRASLFLLVASLPLGIVGYAAYAVHAWQRTVSLEREGLRVEGTVRATRTFGGSRNPSFELDVEYPDPRGGAMRRANVAVDDALFRRLPAGTRHEVWVHPRDSSDVELAGNALYLGPLTQSAIGIILLIIAAVAGVRVLRAHPSTTNAAQGSRGDSGGTQQRGRED
jgi:hypothetical protein